jgi:paraquat-inducible protein B
MNDTPDELIAEPRVVPSRRISLVWAIPIVAALVAAFLGWHTLSQQGPVMTISFHDAAGLEAGKTRVKFKDVELGVIDHIALSANLSHVEVHAQMRKEAAAFLTDRARFWVVRPRLSASGVSGLETLVSGAYIAVDPGPEGGAKQLVFTGLEDPPIVRSDVAGQSFVLKAARIGSLGPGSPVFYRDFNVGYVLGYDPGDMGDNVTIHVFIRAPYDRYVRDGSRFWNASGLSVKIGSNGVQVQLASLQALVAGGITFDTPQNVAQAEPSREGTEFRLYESEDDAVSARLQRRIPLVSYFEGSSVRGLDRGSPVEMYGIRIGTVTEVKLEFDRATNRARLPVNFELEPERLGLPEETAKSAEDVHAAAAQMIARGLRSQLQSSNLLTGQLVLALDYFPNAPPAELAREGASIVLPSMPPQMEGLARSASEIMDKLSNLPLDQIADNLNKTLSGTNELANAPELKQTIVSLAATVASLRDTMKHVDAGLTPTMRRLPEIAGSLQATLTKANKLAGSVDNGYGDESKFRRDIDRLLAQLNDTARSVRVLTDLLSQNPEALVRGWPGQEAER